jgi:hypothetical protein
MRSRFATAMLGAVSLMIVVAAIAALDEDVRTQVTAILAGDLSNVSAFVGVRVQEGTRAIRDLTYQADGYRPLSVFAVGAGVLVIFLRKL